jgi:hypothetical protein
VRYERLSWIGNVVLAGIAIVLAWVPLRAEVGKWGSVGIAVLVVTAAIAMFPRQRSDGSTARLINSVRPKIRGHHNPTMVAGERSTQIVNEGGGTFNIGREKES